MSENSCFAWTRMCFLMMFAISVTSQLPAQPSISLTSPLAVRPGGANDVKIRGSNLASVSELWASFPCNGMLTPDVTNNGKNAEEFTYRFKVPATTPVGVHAIRVATSDGASPLKLILIDDLPSVAQQGTNTSQAAAQAVSLPIAIDGAITALARDHYKFKVAAGQSLSFEVLARRLGSPLDPILRVVDAKGRELAYSDDVPGLQLDSRLCYKFETSGEYTVEVSDIRYKGGDNYYYRLRIGDFPCVFVPYPMGVKRGSMATVSFAGSHIENVQPVNFQVPADPFLDWINMGAKRTGGKSSGFVTLSVGDSDEFVETEPNDDPMNPNRVQLGTNINGRFDKASDRDHFVVTAKKGQKFTLRGITRRQGSPSAIYMRLLNSDGGQVAEARDFGVVDPVINYIFPSDGDYTLLVQHRDHLGGSQYAYRVVVRPTQVGFTLTASADRVNIPVGGTASVTVAPDRQGYQGPITVAAFGLPKGITNTPTVIGSGRPNVIMTLIAAADAPTGKVFPIQITGTAKIGDSDFQANATLSGALKAVFSGLPWPPQTLSRAVAVAVGPKPEFSLRIEPQQIVFGRDLKAIIKVIATRDKDYDEQITLAVTPAHNGLPGGISAALKPIPKGENEINIVFSANNKAPLGDFTANLTGTLEQGKEKISQPVPGIGMKLQRPLSVKAGVETDRLMRGGQLKVIVSVERNPSLKGPVVVTFQNLPKGVTAVAATIHPDKNEVEVWLTAVQGIQEKIVRNVTAKGEVTVGMTTFAATSPAISINVE